MRSASSAAATESAPGYRGRPVNFGRATRRAIRQAAQLADETNSHSFRLHADGSVTFVRWRANPPPQAPQRNSCEAKERQKNGEPSKRAQVSNERARKHNELHEKAVLFRCTAAFRHWRQEWSAASCASAASQTHPRVSGDGLPRSAAVSTMDADDASPLRASREVGVSMLPPQPMGRVGDFVPGCVAGCGSPTTGGVGPPGARPQHMCVPRMHSPHWGAPNVAMSQPPLWSPYVLRGPPDPPRQSVDARDTFERVRMQVREQHFMPFMQYHMQQGSTEHDARIAWDVYEQRVSMERMN